MFSALHKSKYSLVFESLKKMHLLVMLMRCCNVTNKNKMDLRDVILYCIKKFMFLSEVHTNMLTLYRIVQKMKVYN